MLNSTAKRRRLSLRARQEEKAAYLCLIPAFLGLSLITYLPLISVFVLGFYKWRGTSAPVFTGFQNYIRLFTTDPFFIDSIKVTVIFSLIAVAGSLVYSLLTAMLLNRRIPARGFFRAAFYVPYILPLAAVYIGWSWLYEPNIGLFSYILSSIGVTGFKFLLDSRSVLPSLAVISVWLSGNLIVIFLAGLQNVPRVYHEAGEIDGANARHRFIHITVPCMSPIIFYNLLMSLIANMQIIVPALSITKGGPSKGSMFMTYLMYDQGFVNGQLGYASAISFLLFCLIGVFTAILFATSGKMVFYEGGDDK